MDGSGDVLVAHTTLIIPYGPGFIDKLDGHTGALIWRRTLEGGTYSTAMQLAIDPYEDIVVSNVAHQTVVEKLRGADGAEQWHHVLSDYGMGARSGYGSLATDAIGNVVVSSKHWVSRLAGGDGAELWHASPGGAFLWSLVDSADDVVAGSVLGGGVVRLSGNDGSTLWQAAVSTCAPGVMTPSGNVVALGSCGSLRGEPFTIVALDGTSGGQLWQQSVGGSRVGGAGGQSLNVDATGNIWVAGSLDNLGTCDDFAVLEFAADTGARLSQLSIDGTATATNCDLVCLDEGNDSSTCHHVAPGTGTDRDQATVVRFDAQGALIVAGVLSNSRNGRTHDDPVLVKVTDRLAANVMTARIKAGRQSFRVGSRDRGILVPARGNPGDPTREEASLDIQDPETGAEAIFELPPRGWRASRDPVTGRQQYQFRDGSGRPGRCRKVQVKTDGPLRAECTRSFSDKLPGGGVGTIVARLRLGTTAARYCLRGSGDILPSVAGRTIAFSALDMSPPSTCQ